MVGLAASLWKVADSSPLMRIVGFVLLSSPAVGGAIEKNKTKKYDH